MREIIAWVVPVLVAVLLIQTTAELLYLRALASHAMDGDRNGKKRETIRGPVHEVDRDVTAGGIIT
jgi:hypothetical protein